MKSYDVVLEDIDQPFTMEAHRMTGLEFDFVFYNENDEAIALVPRARVVWVRVNREPSEGIVAEAAGTYAAFYDEVQKMAGTNTAMQAFAASLAPPRQ